MLGGDILYHSERMQGRREPRGYPTSEGSDRFVYTGILDSWYIFRFIDRKGSGVLD